jgi:hypothetical protein
MAIAKGIQINSILANSPEIDINLFMLFSFFFI